MVTSEQYDKMRAAFNGDLIPAIRQVNAAIKRCEDLGLTVRLVQEEQVVKGAKNSRLKVSWSIVAGGGGL